MVAINEIKVGDLVRIVDKWAPNLTPPANDPINSWLGKTMTVAQTTSGGIHMIETGDSVYWFPDDIAEIIRVDSSDAEDLAFEFSPEDFDSFLFN